MGTARESHFIFRLPTPHPSILREQLARRRMARDTESLTWLLL